jgi:hypothetical protein
MLRNLSSVNGRPSRPTRSWRKRTGPGESRRTATAVASISGQESRIPTDESRTSTARLRRSLQGWTEKPSLKIRYEGRSAPTAILPVIRSYSASCSRTTIPARRHWSSSSIGRRARRSSIATASTSTCSRCASPSSVAGRPAADEPLPACSRDGVTGRGADAGRAGSGSRTSAAVALSSSASAASSAASSAALLGGGGRNSVDAAASVAGFGTARRPTSARRGSFSSSSVSTRRSGRSPTTA